MHLIPALQLNLSESPLPILIPPEIATTKFHRRRESEGKWDIPALAVFDTLKERNPLTTDYSISKAYTLLYKVA